MANGCAVSRRLNDRALDCVPDDYRKNKLAMLLVPNDAVQPLQYCSWVLCTRNDRLHGHFDHGSNKRGWRPARKRPLPVANLLDRVSNLTLLVEDSPPLLFGISAIAARSHLSVSELGPGPPFETLVIQGAPLRFLS